MGFELGGVIKCVLYNKDGTVDYVFDNDKLNEIITLFINNKIKEIKHENTIE